MMTGTGIDKKTGDWVHDIKNTENGKRAYGLTDKQIMKTMTIQEKNEYRLKFLI